MRTVKSGARRQNVGLTVPMATRQARKIVDQVMPGVGATVESRLSADPATLTPVVITHITFPPTTDASDLACWAERAPGALYSTWSEVDVTITRAVA